jgi:hypothetical protein
MVSAKLWLPKLSIGGGAIVPSEFQARPSTGFSWATFLMTWGSFVKYGRDDLYWVSSTAEISVQTESRLLNRFSTYGERPPKNRI